MDKAVVTAVSGRYWKMFSVSWIASLREYGKYTGPVVIFVDQPGWNEEVCKQLNVTLIPTNLSENPRSSAIRAIPTLPKGIYSFWDSDAYFTSPIEDIFEVAANSLCVTNNPGFVAGGPDQWKHVRAFSLAADQLVGPADFSRISKYCLAATLGDEWNCTSLGKIGAKTKVMHMTGNLKNVANQQFATLHNSVHKKYEFFISKGRWPQALRFARPIL